MRLQDKVAIVTGGGSGIGRGICLRFAEERASVVVADIDPQRAEETVALVRAAGGQAMPVAADASIRQQVQSMLAQALDRFERYDILVNNAGVLRRTPLLELKEEEWDRTLAVNLKSMFLCTQEAARYWVRERRRGKVVNMGSVISEFAVVDSAHYAASKGGVKMLTRAAALELAPYEINVNAIGPGGTQTNLTGELSDPERAMEAGRDIPLGRIAQPRDIANVALFLASEDADYMTGQLILVDGGKTVKI